MSEGIAKGFVTLNPVVGCPIGCRFCYARRIAEKYGMVDDFSVPQFFPNRIPSIRRKSPTMFFLDSMSDASAWREEWWREVLDAVAENPQHEYMLLTKRPDLLEGTGDFAELPWVWLGTSVTCGDDLWRLNSLRRIDAPSRMVSFEPLLGDVGEVDLSGIGWAVIGEETGPEAHAHRARPEWAWGIVRQAGEAGIPVSVRPPMSGRDGMPSMDEMPPSVRAVVAGHAKGMFPTFDALLSP